MIQITKQQIDARWDILPVNLREILYSPDYGKIIWDVCEANHLTNEKIGKIAGLCGYVIMGFIHPEDLAKEIKNATGIHSEIAETIAKEIDRKIFTPIGNEIDKIYAPAETLAEKKITEENAPAEISVNHVIDLRAKPEEAEPIGPLPAMPRPENFTDEELVDLRTFEKSGGAKEEKESKPAGGSDAPVIIHKEAQFKPVPTLKRSLGGMFNFLKKEEIPPPPASLPVAARIEIEDKDRKEKFEPGIAKTEDPKIRVVHYSQFQTPLAPPAPTSTPAPTSIPTPTPSPASTSASILSSIPVPPAAKQTSEGNVIDLRNFEIKQSDKPE